MLPPPLLDRIERERAAHTEDDVLGRSVQLKDRFPHIWAYPGLLRLRAAFEAHAAETAGSRVLDLGCGRGMRARALLRQGAQVWGVDISPVYVEEAQAAARADGHPEEQFVFTTADAHALPFPEAHFDVVVGEGILHHLDLNVALAEVRRVLRPEGRALFIEPLLDNPLLKAFRRFTPRARTEDERPLSGADLDDIRSSQWWDVESQYCGLLGAAGAVVTSLVIPSRPDNVLLRAADRAERALHDVRALQPMHQYVLLNLVRR